jgi:hypothetical protein
MHAALPLAGESQTLPQAPQFSGSLLVSTQRPSHEVPAQSIVHSPLSQVAAPFSPAMQLVPHAPQLPSDELKLTHVPPQLVLSASHASVHAPLEQTLPRLQRAPHAPQCSGSLLRSAQSSPHDTSPSLQRTPHFAPSHVATPSSIAAQRTPHSPQFFGSLSRLTHTPPQATKPSLHTKLQRLERHTGVP